MSELGKVNVISIPVPEWMRRNAQASNVKKMHAGRLDFPDRPCQACEDRIEAGRPVCEWCQGSGIEWLSYIKGYEDVMDPRSSAVAVPASVARDGRWHISVAHRKRLPTWAELRVAQSRLLPKGIDFVIPFPREEHWMNLHEFVLHFWEVRDPHLQDTFAEAAYDGPTIQEDPSAAFAEVGRRGFEMPR